MSSPVLYVACCLLSGSVAMGNCRCNSQWLAIILHQDQLDRLNLSSKWPTGDWRNIMLWRGDTHSCWAVTTRWQIRYWQNSGWRLACSNNDREVGVRVSLAECGRVATVGQLLFAHWAWVYSTLNPFMVGKWVPATAGKV